MSASTPLSTLSCSTTSPTSLVCAGTCRLTIPAPVGGPRTLSLLLTSTAAVTLARGTSLSLPALRGMKICRPAWTAPPTCSRVEAGRQAICGL
jgi:hypothetical protein